MDPDAIYHNFHTHAKGIQGLSSGQRIAQQLASNYQQRAITLQKVIDGIQSAWTGDASEAASQGMAPIAEGALATHGRLGDGQDLVARQMGSFQDTVHAVQPMPPAPQVQDPVHTLLSGQNLTSMYEQIGHYSAVGQSNVDAYDRYVGASRFNATLPTMTPAGAPTAPVSAVPASPPAPNSNPSTGPRIARGSAGARRPEVSSTSGSTASGAVSAVPASVSPATVARPDTTRAASAPVITGDGGRIANRLGGDGAVDGRGPIADDGGGAPDTAGAPDSGARVDAPWGSRSGSGPAAPSPRSVSGPRPGSGGAADEGPEPGLRGGAATTAEEEPLLAGERAGAPGAGELAGGPFGAGHADGDEDGRHRRKYEYGEDPQELFGGVPKVAAPVLGETKAQRAARAGDRDTDPSRPQ